MTARAGLVSTIAVTLLFVAEALLAGYVGSGFTTPALDPWYASLTKPDLNPPNWVFPVVWTSLFVLMGIAAGLVWRAAGLTRGWFSYLIYGVQLILNVGWSYFFFGIERPDLAFFEIWALIAAIALMLILFVRHSRLAGLLILPYLGWVSFAAYLNWSIVALNP